MPQDNAMTDRHEPSSEFLTHLRRESAFALRCDARGRHDAPRSRLLGALRLPTLVLLSLLTGAGVVLAAERLQDSRQLERARASHRIQLELATLKRDHARERAARVEQQAEAGVISLTELAESQQQWNVSAFALRHLELDAEALALGVLPTPYGAPAALAAPLVRGRDFTSEHLHLDAEALKAALAHATEAHARFVTLAEAGVVSSTEVASARAAVEAVERDSAQLGLRLALRTDFLQGRASAMEVEQRDLVRAAEARRTGLAKRLEVTRQGLERAEQLTRAGVAQDPSDLRLKVVELEAELALADLELEALRQL